MAAVDKGIKIKDRVLASYQESKSELGFKTIGSIHFYGKEKDLNLIKEYLLSNFNVYQKDVTKFGEHEVHLWVSSDKRNIQLSFNSEKNGEERNKELFTEINSELRSTFQDLDVYVEYGLTYQFTKEKVEDFLLNYKVDLENLEINKFSKIKPHIVGFPKISEEAKKRLYQIDREVREKLVGKKILLNNMIGKFKRLPDGDIGFFKERSRTRYYNIRLYDFQTIELL